MQRLALKEKFGYGLGDTASNIVFQVVINFMLYFYTDVFGITAAAAGTLMLAVRLFDAVTDPIMGGIADRTRTRWGSYRPYLLWVSIPYG
ncbi:MAG: MFS transporter, partial [Xanthomonadales bacterium]|nr:MFS transporter [Xanthomonadales bacterium]